VTLIAFAAERRAAAPLLLASAVSRCRSIYAARQAYDSKLAARHGCGTRWDRQTDRERMD